MSRRGRRPQNLTPEQVAVGYLLAGVATSITVALTIIVMALLSEG